MWVGLVKKGAEADGIAPEHTLRKPYVHGQNGDGDRVKEEMSDCGDCNQQGDGATMGRG